jgi:hypothetical protein
MLEKAQQAEEMSLAEPSLIPPQIMSGTNSSLITGSSKSSFVIGGSKKGGVLEKDSTTGRISIGYRK